MTDQDRELARVRAPVLLLSAAAWTLLLIAPGAFAHCAIMTSAGASWRTSLLMLVAMNPPAPLAAGWGIMLVAMMGPVLIAPVYHVRMQSFQSRRARSISLFVAGYAAIWLVFGSLLLTLAVAATLFAWRWCIPVVGTLTTLLWQFSPIKQHCLNRSHAHIPLAAFGFSADRDAFRFGLSHGIWCAGSCWALMMFSMLLPRGHVAAMAATAFLIFSERIEQPVSPRWSWRLSGKLMRIVFAQTRIRLNSPRLAPAGLSSSGSKV